MFGMTNLETNHFGDKACLSARIKAERTAGKIVPKKGIWMLSGKHSCDDNNHFKKGELK